MSGTQSAGGDGQRWPSASAGWSAAGVLALASVVSQADRTVLSLMAGPIKETFTLSDTAFSLLHSVAFGVFYVLACIPLGRMVDRYPRRLVLAACMAFFSIFAMASGLVRSYAQLFLMRIGVGVGEASVTPAAFSMLSDSFPPQRLGRPIGVFLMSAPFGQGLTLIAAAACCSGSAPRMCCVRAGLAASSPGRSRSSSSASRACCWYRPCWRCANPRGGRPSTRSRWRWTT